MSIRDETVCCGDSNVGRRDLEILGAHPEGDDNIVRVGDIFGRGAPA
jgi:hypothetical protein